MRGVRSLFVMASAKDETASVGEWLAGAGTLVALAVLACAAPGVASAATLDVPADFTTIQAAVDAADPGDTVAVGAGGGPYLESVNVDTEGISIVGAQGRPVIDGFDPGDSPATLKVGADNVEVRHVAIHNEDAYDCDADRCSVRDVKFRGLMNADCVEVDGDDALVKDNRMEACGNNAVDVNGADARVLGNRANGIDADCISVNGPGATVKGNLTVRCEDDEGIDLDNADGALVEGNVVRHTDNGGIDVTGDEVRVQGNEATLSDSNCFELDGEDGVFTGNVGKDCDTGARFAGDGWVVRENEITHVHDNPCLRLTGDGGVISRNIVDACYRGIEIQGEGSITRNHIADVHTDDGISAFCSDDFDDPDPPDPAACDDVLVADNVVDGAGDDDAGISVSIEEATGKAVIRGNTVSDTFDDGIEAFMSDGLVEGNVVSRAGAEEEEGIDVTGSGNVIQDNASNRNGGHGIRVGGGSSVGNVIRNNTVRANNQDGINADGTGDVVSGNVAIGNIGDGIQLDGTAVDVTGNRASGNRIDCASDGSVDVNQGNDCADGSDFLVTSSGLG